MERLLLLEDDAGLSDGLTYALEKNGFRVTAVGSVREALGLLEGPDGQYDLLLLDVTLPDGSGFAVCERVRRAGNDVPVIFLTAAEEETSVIRGLDGGGDDYITKPFRLGELVSRIRAVLRRRAAADAGRTKAAGTSGAAAGTPGAAEGTSGAAEETGRQPFGADRLRCGVFCLEPLEGRVYAETVGGRRPLELTAMEYRLLCLFLRNPGRVLTREQILDALWDGFGSYVDDNTLSVYVRRLREKTEEDPSAPRHLLTVRGMGYRWEI